MIECPATCLSCAQSPQTSTWSHLSCLSILASSYADGDGPSRDNVLSYGMLTLPTWGKRGARLPKNDHPFDRSILADYTSLLLGNTFSNELVGMLPEEIILEIAKQLGPMCLLAIRESQILVDGICSEPPQTNNSVDFSAVIYGSTLSFRGHSYISKISNRPNEKGNLRKLRGRLRTRGCRALISFDEIGVRGIRTFEPEVSSMPTDGSPWYRVGQPSPDAKFECVTNVS